MKKMGNIILMFLLLSFIALASTSNIASFNVLRLGNSQKNYPMTASVLADFDLIGLQEVMNQKGVEKLVYFLEKETKEKWDYHISPYSVGESSYKEYYAYIWKANKVVFLKERGFYSGETKEFSREPYGADFKIGEFDFTYVLIHIVFGKDESRRRSEIFKMHKVYDYFQNLDNDENDIIIAGDFNMPALDESFENLLGHKDEIIYIIDPVMKTTLGKNGLSSSYDNIFLSNKYTQEFTGYSGSIDFTEGKYGDRKKNISDHLPIFFQVNILTDDD
ncbi:endonuclease/exonuclease/phosphatase family protein [Fusobacterium sp. PH5-44]|uniref:endonuclease/exonuclease/phosphatase family protein n=1 Tax=unclassified Fusobacterium TaxID=2648384 RepID=UPI003D238661